MSTRRVRRDSETSTDSWSLVEEEDRLDDDFSLNSTDNDEGAELDSEPIIEEPPTSDEEEDDTASEKSLDSDSEDSELDDGSEASDDEDVEEAQETQEVLEESEDSDLSSEESDEECDVDSESEKSEISDEEEEEEESEIDDVSSEVGELDEEELAEAAMKLKEDEKWMDEELAETKISDARRSCRILLVFSMFIILFPLADIFTSWMLAYHNHSYASETVCRSPPCYVYVPSYKSDWSVQKKEVNAGLETSPITWRGQQQPDGSSLELLKDILARKAQQEPLRNREILEIFTNQSYQWKMQSDSVTKPITPAVLPPTTVAPISPTVIRTRWNFNISTKHSTCRALAPVPPAPFSPRRIQKRQIPRHQPCLVHVNQSKWTCQKNVPSVIYSTTPYEYTVAVPRSFKKKSMGKTSSWFQKFEVKKRNMNSTRYDVCGKKASQSMRIVPKPTDQCHSRHFSKFTPRRKHIAYKTPLPCQLPIYKPTVPKKTFKPTQDDWHQKRSHHRAQLRQRA